MVAFWAVAASVWIAATAYGPPPCAEGEVEIFPEMCGKTPWGPPAGSAEGSYCSVECAKDSDCKVVLGTTASCLMNQGDGRTYCQYVCDADSDCPGSAQCQRNIVSHICTHPPLCVAGGMTGWLLCKISSSLNSVLEPLLTSTAMLVLGFLLMAQFHLFPFFGVSRSEALRIFGQGVVVLQLYFDADLRVSNPFVLSCLYVFMDRVVIFSLFDRLGKLRLSIGVASSEHRRIVLDAESIERAGEGRDVKNKYMDPSFPLRGSAIIFVVQLSLMAYFVYFINADTASHDISNVSFWKWLVAILITLCVDEDEAGAVYDGKYWRELFQAHPKVQTMRTKRRKVLWFVSISYGFDWWIRYIFDTVINAICRTVIMSTAPILLSTEEPMDFIKDCLALFFIAKLDDYDDAKSLDDALAECEAKHDARQDASDHLKRLHARRTSRSQGHAYEPVGE